MAISFYNLGLSGLRAQRARMQVNSQNLANVDTPGYSRQRLTLTAEHQRLGGVAAGGVRRVEDEAMRRALSALGERAGYHDSSARLLAEAEAAAGGLAGHPVGRALDGFFAAASELSLDARSIPRRQALVDAARQLESRIRSGYADLERVRTQADDRLRGGVDETNRLLEEIARINRQLGSAEAGGAQAPNLRDQQDRAVARLSELMDARARPREDGGIDVEAPDGYLLVAGVEHSPLAVRGRADGHLDLVATGRGDGSNIPSDRIGGELGGLVSTRDGVLARQLSALDDLAFDLGNAVNAALTAGTDLDGNAGAALFNVSAQRAGAARDLSLANADPRRLGLSGSGSAGDNAVALTLAGLADRALVRGQRPGDAVASALYELGNATKTANDELMAAGDLYTETKVLRESMAGVSMDEELVDLTAAQRAFQGAAKIVATADEVAQEILGLKR